MPVLFRTQKQGGTYGCEPNGGSAAADPGEVETPDRTVDKPDVPSLAVPECDNGERYAQ